MKTTTRHTDRPEPRSFDWQLDTTWTPARAPQAWDGTECGAPCGCKVLPAPVDERPARQITSGPADGSRS